MGLILNLLLIINPSQNHTKIKKNHVKGLIVYHFVICFLLENSIYAEFLMIILNLIKL